MTAAKTLEKPVQRTRQTNLFNAALLPRSDLLSPGRIAMVLVWVAVWVVLISAWSMYVAFGGAERNRDLELELQAARTQVAAQRPDAIKKKNALQAQIKAVDDRLLRAREVLAAMAPWTPMNQDGAGGSHLTTPGAVLQALAIIKSPSVWLTRIEHDVGSATMTLRGVATNTNAVAEYIKELREQPDLIGITFDRLEVQAHPDRANIWTFSVISPMRLAPAGSIAITPAAARSGP